MTPESAPLTESPGVLLRRFLPAPGDASIIPATVFRPSASDTDGISVSIRALPNPVRRVLSGVRKSPESYSVCEFDIGGIDGLTAVASPTVSDPGHATIPQIAPPYDKLKDTHERKIQIRIWMAELMQRAKTVHRAGDAIPDPE